jgi:hypothetical protein
MLLIDINRSVNFIHHFLCTNHLHSTKHAINTTQTLDHVAGHPLTRKKQLLSYLRNLHTYNQSEVHP